MNSNLERLRKTILFGEAPIPLEHFLDRLGLTVEQIKGKRILDIGSGLNRGFARQVYSAGGSAIISLEPRASYEQSPKDSRLPLVAGFAHALPFSDQSFDLIVSSASVPMWLTDKEEIQQAFKEVLRVLKPGGEGRFYPPFHQIFWEEYRAGTILLPPEAEGKSNGTKAAYATLVGLNKLGIDNLSLMARHVGNYEFIYHSEVLAYKKPL